MLGVDLTFLKLDLELFGSLVTRPELVEGSASSTGSPPWLLLDYNNKTIKNYLQYHLTTTLTLEGNNTAPLTGAM